MGLRGPQAKANIKSTAPTATAAPDWLDKDAAEYWHRHRDELTANGILTAGTEDSFTLLCDLWGRVRAMQGSPTSRAYLDAVKAFTSLAKSFRLLPTEKPVEVQDRHADKGEIDFP